MDETVVKNSYQLDLPDGIYHPFKRLPESILDKYADYTTWTTSD